MKSCTRAWVGALLATTVATLVAQTAAAEPVAKPAFTVLPPHGTWAVHAPGAALATWSGVITYNSHPYRYTMVGTNPATSNMTTTVTVYIVPVVMNYTKATYQSSAMKFNPLKDQQNGVNIVKNILKSPLFKQMDWNWGGTDVGTGQYNDAFQRASFWQDVAVNTDYHVVLTPSVLPKLTIKPTRAQGGGVVRNPFGGTGSVGEMNINYFDQQLQSYMSAHPEITPSAFVLFVTDNIYLTSGGCCIGGYHSANGNGQTYGTATYAYSPGALVFSNDIAAFSHEIGEWYADPLITSNSPCGLLEVGDPLERLSNYGTFPVVYRGVTWHPQALAMMEYFGSPANFSVNNWLDNQNLLGSVCQNGA